MLPQSPPNCPHGVAVDDVCWDCTAKLAVDAGFAVGMHQHRGEIEPFAAWLAARKPRHVIEIGTLHGGTATMFHQLCMGQVITIDLPGGRFGGADHNLDLARCQERGARLRASCSRVYPVLGDSHDPKTVEAVRGLLGGQRADLLFIDGDHTYEGVRRDYELYAPLVREGGVIAFHDILDTPQHRAAGCRVDQLWLELPGHKAAFSINGAWGAIGVTFKGPDLQAPPLKRRGHGDTVTATKVAYERIFDDDVPDGGFCFKSDEPRRVYLVCPCGCKQLMYLAIRRNGQARTGTEPQWEWDGNLDTPTLAPSIRDLGACRFHGFLRHGAWTFCSDSGHGART